MAEKEVSEALFHLRTEVEGLENQNPELRQKLESLLDDLEDQLETAEEVSPLHLVEDMKAAVTHFEVEHPRITGILNDLMVSLSNLGI